MSCPDMLQLYQLCGKPQESKHLHNRSSVILNPTRYPRNYAMLKIPSTASLNYSSVTCFHFYTTYPIPLMRLPEINIDDCNTRNTPDHQAISNHNHSIFLPSHVRGMRRQASRHASHVARPTSSYI